MGRRALIVVGLAVAGAQAGHLVAYQARFGAAAQSIQSSGAHAYFPAAVKTSLGAVALVLMAALLLIGLARLVAAGIVTREAAGPSYLSLLAILFTAQLFLYSAQEVTEALIAGAPADSAPNLLLWGTLGQLPVALITAMALRWLWSRVGPAAGELLSIACMQPPHMSPAPVAIPLFAGDDRALRLSHAAHSPCVKRGPPPSSRFRTP
jgi:hypothetical protein